MSDQTHANEPITKNSLPDRIFTRYQKTYSPMAIKMDAPFTCVTLEGNIVNCDDGWLVVDSHGFPYPVDRLEFEKTYKPTDQSRRLRP